MADTSEQWRAEHLRSAIEAAGVALWSWNVRSGHFCMDERAFDLWGLTWRNDITFEDLSSRIHPADRERVRTAFAATRAHLGSYEIDFRVLINNVVRWISARGQGSGEGKINDMVFGIFLDVTSRKQAEEGHELLAGEMSHRVKNLLAITSSLTKITSRSTTTSAEMAGQLIKRLTALGRAHDLVRPLPGHEGKAALLGDLITVLLAPYDDGGAFAGRIRVSVPRMSIGEETATTMALIVHELATNALKYGALSVAEGTLDIAGQDAETHLILTWIEQGGPAVNAPSSGDGFGSIMIKRAVAGQLDGRLAYDWASSGLAVTLHLSKACLAA